MWSGTVSYHCFNNLPKLFLPLGMYAMIRFVTLLSYILAICYQLRSSVML
jgi:hypothetical protein